MRKAILSTAEVANLFSVTETTVKRWADEGKLKCQKTPGGHRKFETKGVIEFAEMYGFSPTGTLSLPEGDELSRKMELAVLRRDFNSMAQAFAEKAVSPQQSDVYKFLSYLYQHHVPLTDIYDSVIRPGMQQIGDLWYRGEISVAHEHQAASETVSAIIRLQSELRMGKQTALLALCACPEEEQHDIGLRCVASILGVEGWTVHYLGARTPMDSIGEFCRELKPSMVCLSTTMEENARALVAGIGKLKKALHAKKVRLVLGGRPLMDGGRQTNIRENFFATSAGLLEYVRTEFQKTPKREMQTSML